MVIVNGLRARCGLGTVLALLEGRHPPRSWIEHWSVPGRDPVHVSWEQSASPPMMLQLLCLRRF